MALHHAKRKADEAYKKAQCEYREAEAKTDAGIGKVREVLRKLEASKYSMLLLALFALPGVIGGAWGGWAVAGPLGEKLVFSLLSAGGAGFLSLIFFGIGYDWFMDRD